MDLAPGFWAWLAKAHGEGNVASVRAIHDEIMAGTAGDDLASWAKTVPTSFWLRDTADSLSSAGELAEWVNHTDRPYSDAAKAKFMDSGDLRLIAQGYALEATVVTREVPAPAAQKIVKIPDACAAFGIACSQPFPVYRALGLKLN